MQNNPSQSGKKSKKPFVISAFVFGILLIVSLIFLFRKKKNSDLNQKNSNDEQLKNAEAVRTMLMDSGLSEVEAAYWTAVSAHETAGWTSDIYKSNNNLFGMKQPQKRNTTSTGETNGYATYQNHADSVKDLLLWINFTQFPESHDSIRKLTSDMKAKGYFEADYMAYTNSCVKWLSQLFNTK